MSLKVGVFIPGDAQVLDVACVDVLHMMSTEYLSLLETLPAHVAASAPSISIVYITSPKAPNLLAPLTAGMTIQATHSWEHPDVQPGLLDIVFVPGPDPAKSFDQAALDFLAAHAACENTDILSVCTGIFLCGAAGLIKGRTVCGPRGLQDRLRKEHPDAKLVGEKYRWWQDGRLWTSGGITNGNDMVVAYARTRKEIPGSIVELGAKMADVGDRAQQYGESPTWFTLGIVWNIFQALFAKKHQKKL